VICSSLICIRIPTPRELAISIGRAPSASHVGAPASPDRLLRLPFHQRSTAADQRRVVDEVKTYFGSGGG
jgi:hypothetical protein